MNHFVQIAEGIEVGKALSQLAANNDLWGRDPERTDNPASPHHESKDIWLRFRPRSALLERKNFDEPHFSEFYPAWHTLTALHPIVFGVMSRLRATHLGGILMTKIPPGGVIYPHVDRGWHAEQMAVKAYVILHANDRCVNRCGDEVVTMQTGTCWLFNNQVIHSVENRGDTDRIALIQTMRIT